jgi:hypothetical protein
VSHRRAACGLRLATEACATGVPLTEGEEISHGAAATQRKTLRMTLAKHAKVAKGKRKREKGKRKRKKKGDRDAIRAIVPQAAELTQ